MKRLIADPAHIDRFLPRCRAGAGHRGRNNESGEGCRWFCAPLTAIACIVSDLRDCTAAEQRGKNFRRSCAAQLGVGKFDDEEDAAAMRRAIRRNSSSSSTTSRNATARFISPAAAHCASGNRLMLRVIETHDHGQQWLGVADIMRAEAMRRRMRCLIATPRGPPASPA